MKNLILSLLAATTICCQIPVKADPQYDAARHQFDEFLQSKGQWELSLKEVEDNKSTSMDKADKAFSVMVEKWNNIPEFYRAQRSQYMNRVWFTMAQESSKLGAYKDALNYLNEEMQFQYQHAEGRKVFLSEQNQNFYQEVVKVEAQVLGHLGQNYYLNSIDCYLMPVGASQSGKLNSFVSMRETSADEEYNITIPPLPKDQDRKIFYLLAPDQNGNYAIVNTIQLIGYIGKKTQISLSESVSTPVLTLSGITNTVEMKEGVPFKYVPVSSQPVKLEVLPTGFRLIP